MPFFLGSKPAFFFSFLCIILVLHENSGAVVRTAWLEAYWCCQGCGAVSVAYKHGCMVALSCLPILYKKLRSNIDRIRKDGK